jgi:hypothetical protein
LKLGTRSLELGEPPPQAFPLAPDSDGMPPRAAVFQVPWRVPEAAGVTSAIFIVARSG